MTEGALFLTYSNIRHCLSFTKFLYLNLKKLLDYKREQKSISQSNDYDYGCWQEPPNEILEKIVQNLRLSDRIRSGIVCKSWRLVIMCSIPSHEFPWLVLPQSPDCRNDKTLSFFSISDGKIVDLKLPRQVQGGWFYGSSKGWLIMIKEQGLNTQISLLNPISGALHQLPSLATVPSFQNYVQEKNWKLYGGSLFFHQIVLSTSNINSDQCVVAASFDSCRELALCRPGGKTWSVFRPFEHKHETVAQLLFSSGKLYAMIGGKIKKEGIIARTLRFGDHALELTMVYVGVIELPIWETKEYHDHAVYLQCLCSPFLLESTKNEVLLIQKIEDYFIKVNNDPDQDEEADILEGEDDDEGNDMEEEGNFDEGDENYNDNDADDVEGNEEDDEEGEYHNEIEDWDWDESIYTRTSTFKVYKIDSKTDPNNFLRLQSLGEQTFFLAEHGSLSLSASNMKEFEKNCIFFATKATTRDVLPKPQISREIGVFYLDTGKIKRSFPSINFSTRSRTSWYVPSL
ncbi:hypothetical protein ACLB2K_012292 [Fragaria x ananassa]